MTKEQEKEVIAYFDYIPIPALATYLLLTPKEVRNIYSNLIDTGEYRFYKLLAKKELKIPLLDARLRRIARQ